MKGKNSFSESEAADIRDLLARVRAGEGQEGLRGRLRQKHGFWITDFDKTRTGFSPSDFDLLVERGNITIRNGC